MAETPIDITPSDISPPPSPPPPLSDHYWCYSCDKSVAVETLSDLQTDVVCFECKNGFVELVSIPDAESVSESDPTSALGTQFIQVLRLIAQASRDQTPPPVPPVDDADDVDENDFLRIELNGWDEDDDDEGDENVVVHQHHVDEIDDDDDDEDNDNDNEGVDDEEDDDDDEDEDEDEHSVVVIPEGVIEDEDGEGYGDSEEVEVESRRRRNDVLRLRLRDFATRAGSQRNRILDWAEILMGLEDHSIEFRLQVPETDTYIGNPGDYVDAAGYEALLQNLAESDGGKRGAPPAAKWAVEKLESVVVGKEEEGMSCAICKENVGVGEVAKNMPCGHGYHGECIVTWLFSRNSCPVCRFELATDDVEYEEERKMREGGVAGSSGSAGGAVEHDLD